MFEKPFKGEISRYFAEDFPPELREAVREAKHKRIIDPDYPYRKILRKHDYEETLHALQIELAKMQRWMTEEKQRIVVIFEGRDAAGKGGCIKRLTANLNPRVARVVALGKPSDRERGQWYFQRYTPYLPSTGEMTIFDRSWYNRAGVEPVMGFCSHAETRTFLAQVPDFELALVDEGIRLVKIWLTVSRAEQMRRFLARESDPLKHWKLSPVDIASLPKWDDYSEARTAMFDRTHLDRVPWTVIRSDDKRRARLATIRTLLATLPYTGKDEAIARAPDPAISGDPSDHLDG